MFKDLSWASKDKLKVIQKVQKLEKDQSLSTINSIKKDRVSNLSNERIVDLMEGLDVDSESTDKEVSIV